MQTHKNPTLREGPAPFKTPSATLMSSVAAPIDKPPKFVQEGKKWLIVCIILKHFRLFYFHFLQEFQKGNHSLVVENAEMNNVVYVYKCTESTIQVRGKINSIVMDSCKKTSVVFDTLVSCIEFINCQSMQMQVIKFEIAYNTQIIIFILRCLGKWQQFLSIKPTVVKCI